MQSDLALVGIAAMLIVRKHRLAVWWIALWLSGVEIGYAIASHLRDTLR